MPPTVQNILDKISGLSKNPTPRLERARLEEFVSPFLHQSTFFTRIVHREGSPLYIFDKKALISSARQFAHVFRKFLPQSGIFYAVKSNNYPGIAEALLEEGFGLDVSSGAELEMALDLGAQRLVFSGPGKTGGELELAAANHDRVVVLMDSREELQRLEEAAAGRDVAMRAGVRLSAQTGGLWRKFGIPLSKLGEFMAATSRCRHIRLTGLHYHVSWNLNPDNHLRFLEQLGAELRRLDQHLLSTLEFIDIGGGFWPECGEWLQAQATPEGQLYSLLGEDVYQKRDHFIRESFSLSDFISAVAAALEKNIFPVFSGEIYVEPGRWICNGAMHILLTVIDRKYPDLVITDGGTNAVGWERFESDYFPVINLSRPSLDEKECLITGSLCTPHDIWGYSYFGQDIQPGDILLIPNQGAYTYSLRQHFIKPLPKVVTVGD
jgi:diaminopimelate decarboxylase